MEDLIRRGRRVDMMRFQVVELAQLFFIRIKLGVSRGDRD